MLLSVGDLGSPSILPLPQKVGRDGGRAPLGGERVDAHARVRGRQADGERGDVGKAIVGEDRGGLRLRYGASAAGLWHNIGTIHGGALRRWH